MYVGIRGTHCGPTVTLNTEVDTPVVVDVKILDALIGQLVQGDRLIVSDGGEPFPLLVDQGQ
jgi:hypothetical protein